MGGIAKESDLYEPVKCLLEGQGYEVKAEIGSADLFAVRGDEPPVIVELKNGFTLTLLHQVIERLKITELVYVAVPEWKGRAGWKAFQKNLKLCRRLGIGAITVLGDQARVHLDPGPYKPRVTKKRTERMLGEFQSRVGDPNKGGVRHKKIVTAYRQDALRCLKVLSESGPIKASQVAAIAGVARARNIMAKDHYGWFQKVERGIYDITKKGFEAAKEYKADMEVL